jgi:hypothetical protein
MRAVSWSQRRAIALGEEATDGVTWRRPWMQEATCFIENP